MNINLTASSPSASRVVREKWSTIGVFFLGTISALMLVGCSEDPDQVVTKIDRKANRVQSEDATASASGAAVVARVGLEGDVEAPEAPQHDPAIEATVASLEEIFQAAKSAGKPVVVDVWSLSCDPCMREFPGLVKLQEEHGEALVCISANIDYDGRPSAPPEGNYSAVMRFLRAQNAKLKNYICGTPSEEVYSTLDIDSIPAVFLFDAEGKEVKRFVDAGETRGFTYEENIVPAVGELLGGAASAAPAAEEPETDSADSGEGTPNVEQPTDEATDSGAGEQSGVDSGDQG